MPSSETAPLAVPPARRRLLVAVAVLALLVPVVLMGSRLWTTTADDVDFAASERDGVAYLRPLVQLVAVTADTQSAAVAGRPVDGGRLRDAAAEVDAVQGRVGTRLGTARRWAQISSQVVTLSSASGSGAAAFTAWSQLTDLELALVRAVGDTSKLILDPALDSYYLMDATLLRVPSVLVTAGRVTDQAVLSAAPLVIATSRSQVQSDAAAVDEGLRKGLATTRSRTLGPSLLPQLDRLRAAVSAFAPPTADVGAAPAARTAQQDATARGPVRDAALALETSGLAQLDLLLATRQSQGQSGRTLVFGLLGAGCLVAFACWWLSGARRRPGDDEDDDVDGGGGSGLDGAVEADQPPELVEARELLESRRLVRVGRAVSATREKR